MNPSAKSRVSAGCCISTKPLLPQQDATSQHTSCDEAKQQPSDATHSEWCEKQQARQTDQQTHTGNRILKPQCCVVGGVSTAACATWPRGAGGQHDTKQTHAARQVREYSTGAAGRARSRDGIAPCLSQQVFVKPTSLLQVCVQPAPHAARQQRQGSAYVPTPIPVTLAMQYSSLWWEL